MYVQAGCAESLRREGYEVQLLTALHNGKRPPAKKNAPVLRHWGGFYAFVGRILARRATGSSRFPPAARRCSL